MISVVMPCYNCEAALDRAVRSLRAQTIADWELLAVDDGSDDGTGAALDAWAQTDERIRVFHQENGGAYLGRGTRALRRQKANGLRFSTRTMNCRRMPLLRCWH